jgi:hypothetical protein
VDGKQQLIGERSDQVDLKPNFARVANRSQIRNLYGTRVSVTHREHVAAAITHLSKCAFLHVASDISTPKCERHCGTANQQLLRAKDQNKVNLTATVRVWNTRLNVLHVAISLGIGSSQAPPAFDKSRV